jgi:hypothetical protein
MAKRTSLSPHGQRGKHPEGADRERGKVGVDLWISFCGIAGYFLYVARIITRPPYHENDEKYLRILQERKDWKIEVK